MAGITDDQPKSLGDPDIRAEREVRLRDPHMAELTQFVVDMREKTGKGTLVSHFDPLDGGQAARCLYILEAPGPKAVASGFVSRNNPDETAKNFFLLNQEADIPRELTAIWNIVPWYVGDGKRIRPVNESDINEALPYLDKLLGLLPNLDVLVFVGKKAEIAEEFCRRRLPKAKIMKVMHPSALVINAKPENREKILTTLREVRKAL